MDIRDRKLRRCGFAGSDGTPFAHILIAFPSSRGQEWIRSQCFFPGPDYGEVAGGAVAAYENLVQDFSMVLTAADSLPVLCSDRSCRWGIG